MPQKSNSGGSRAPNVPRVRVTSGRPRSFTTLQLGPTTGPEAFPKPMVRVRFPSHPLKAVRAVRLGRRRVRMAQAFQTQQRDAERDPRALEHEEPDVVVRVGLDD